MTPSVLHNILGRQSTHIALGTFGRVVGSETFIISSLREQVQMKKENKLTFPKHIKIIKGDMSAQLIPPETYCRFPKSKNLKVDSSGDAFVEYSLINTQAIPSIKSRMKNKYGHIRFNEYEKYSSSRGYR